MSSTESEPPGTQHRGLHALSTTALVVGALGVVFGDIGTSPIYTLKECFSPASHHSIPVTPENVLGVVSLIIWSLISLICLKYLAFILRADNKGEGGVLSLLALAGHGLVEGSKQSRYLILLGLFGAALLFGDGMITPAVSVLSAVEGLKEAGVFGSIPETAAAIPAWEHHMETRIVLLTVLILTVLFSVQFMGTHKMGRFFGPITLAWFCCLALLGALHIADAPAILQAFNPWHGLRFLLTGGSATFLILGSVFLAVTGGEALYADMGHFGRSPIRKAWFVIVFPSLLLNYLGQGAMLLEHPEAAVSPFFRMVSGWASLPLVLLATAATVIASQALITGTYSLTLSAIQLGYLPRLSVRHTSEHSRGQIYIPLVNWLLLAACVTLVVVFRTSSNLAAAYGVAVTMTMLITTLMFYALARHVWQWPWWRAVLLCGLFALIEGLFLAANMLKLLDGGWLPLAVGAVIFALMSTWNRGRALVRARLEAGGLSQELLIESLQRRMPVQVPGTAIFMTGSRGRTPVALLHNLKHNRVIHERVIFLTLIVADQPWVSPSKRLEVEEIGTGFWRITGHYGFMQKPQVPRLLRQCARFGLEVSADDSTFFLGREIIVPASNPGMARWREHLFALTARLAQQPAGYFQIPVGRVIELGQQVEI